MPYIGMMTRPLLRVAILAFLTPNLINLAFFKKRLASEFQFSVLAFS